MAQADRIMASLERAYAGPFTLRRVLDVSQGRFVIFSDHHKGAGDQADEFCAPAYLRALEHYRAREFTLVLLGDVEELWENPWTRVQLHQVTALAAEKSFGPDRYLRIRGNHDDRWMEAVCVSRDLCAFMPVDRVWEAVRFQVVDGTTWLGELFLVHGHQGEFGSDTLSPLARLALRVVYRTFQNLTGIGKQTPAKDVVLRGRHDKTMYQWATLHRKLVLIAGHTHRPVWTSRTHLQKLEEELAALLAHPEATRPPTFAALVAAKRAAIAERRQKDPPAPDDGFRPIECYFNTGCCKFSDGDITGIELEDGVLRLIKWPGPGRPDGGRMVLEEEALADVLKRLP